MINHYMNNQFILYKEIYQLNVLIVVLIDIHIICFIIFNSSHEIK
jgi:hypothetical protein